jgi:hypothetical protein
MLPARQQDARLQQLGARFERERPEQCVGLPIRFVQVLAP